MLSRTPFGDEKGGSQTDPNKGATVKAERTRAFAGSALAANIGFCRALKFPSPSD
jgi:hypothetical protein